MNRLILVGNGFDLAHGMRTSYNDFIFSYFHECFKVAEKETLYSDLLINIKRGHYYNTIDLSKITELSQLLEFAELGANYSYSFGGDNSIEKKANSKAYVLELKNDFLREVILDLDYTKWVDIENKYYQFLLKALKIDNRLAKFKIVEDLNKAMDFIILKLEAFLKEQRSLMLLPQYGVIFNEWIKHEDIVFRFGLNESIKPFKTLFLNFNYTNTIDQYLNRSNEFRLNSSNFEINYIHGKIGDKNNPIVFGFGDELDKEYSSVEGESVQGFLKFIKSFWYSKTSNYHDLIRFIESEKFQVFILGHSCGLSDRTMLNMIFEHENCKSIKIYYHSNNGTNNFTILTEEISRHFTKKAEMRKKIVPFDKSQPMPQVAK